MSKHYQNLLTQLDKLHRHNRQGSFRTRQRYYEAMQRFCRFLAEQFHLERLANIAPKHIYAYVTYLQEQDSAISFGGIQPAASGAAAWNQPQDSKAVLGNAGR